MSPFGVLACSWNLSSLAGVDGLGITLSYVRGLVGLPSLVHYLKYLGANRIAFPVQVSRKQDDRPSYTNGGYFLWRHLT